MRSLDEKGEQGSARVWYIVIGVIITLIIGGLWFIIGYWQDAGSRFWQWLTESLWGRGFWPNGWNIFGASGWTYMITGIVVGVVAAFFWPRTEQGEYDPKIHDYEEIPLGNKRVAFISAGTSVLLIVSAIVIWVTSVDDRSESYAANTKFVVADKSDLGTNLQRLDGKYIEQAEYSQAWEPRVASATGAKTVMKRSSESDSGSQMLLDTMTYTYGSQSGWTAIRDGRKKQPLYGVTFWPGEGSVETCRFTGDYNISKALHGKQGTNLLDEIAGYNKSLFFDETDMWGYCKPAGDPNKVEDDQPVLVIPVKTWDGYGHVATWYSAGVLTITGSSSGKAQINHVTQIEPGQFPGPVYPISLAADQREETVWMAGKWNKWFRDFGYETTDVESQAGNTSEFLLKSKSDGHLYWVTPLTARGSDSQLVIAYSLIRADEATEGKYNALRIYVLPSGDPRAINLEDLEARVKSSVNKKEPGFFDKATGGKLVEFLPLDDENWQVYAEMGGRVVYRITVPADSRLNPVVTALSGIEEQPVKDDEPDSPSQGENSESSCVLPDLGEASEQSMIDCLGDIAQELAGRQS